MDRIIDQVKDKDGLRTNMFEERQGERSLKRLELEKGKMKRDKLAVRGRLRGLIEPSASSIDVILKVFNENVFYIY